MKSYNFTTTNGETYKVRFYETGCYTVTDHNGEHEAGTWGKRPLILSNGKPSKDKNSVLYFAAPFGAKEMAQFEQRVLASCLLREFRYANN